MQRIQIRSLFYNATSIKLQNNYKGEKNQKTTKILILFQALKVHFAYKEWVPYAPLYRH